MRMDAAHNPSRTPETRNEGARFAGLAAVLMFVAIYILPLGLRPLSSPDEARYSEIPREMLASGDWVVPRLNGVRFFEKPVLGYWAVAVSMRLLGENEFAARLPAALSVGLSAVMIGWLARRARVDRLAADIAPVVFLTCTGTYPAGAFINLDGMFSALVTATIAMYFVAFGESNRRKKYLLLAAAGGLCGAAVLTKGFVALVIAIGVVGPYAVWDRRLKDVLRTVWLPLLAAAAVCIPWSVMIARREPDFWHYFFVFQHVHRFLGSLSKHAEQFWFFIPFLLLGTIPWNAFIAAIVIGIRRVGMREPFIRFLVCWAAFPFLFFSASSSKLITYIMPCYPPLALLMTIGLVAYLRSGRWKLVNAGAVVVASLILTGVVFLLVQRFGHLMKFELFGPNEGWRLGIAIAGLSVWALMAMQVRRVTDYRRKLGWIAAGPVPAFALAALIFPIEQRGEQIPGPVLREYAGRITPQTLIVSDRAMVHAVCWNYRRTDVYMLEQRAGELEYGLGYPDSAHRLLDIEGFLALIKPSPQRPPVVLIIPADVRATLLKYFRLLHLEDRIPPPKFELTERKLWIAEF